MKYLSVLLLIGACLFVISCNALTYVPNAKVPDGFVAWYFTTGLSSPRGMIVLPTKDVLVIEGGSANRVTLLFDDDHDGVSNSTERVTIASASGLNHGIAYHDGYLYASSGSTVFRWAYNYTRTNLGNPTTVVSGIPSTHHTSRTLIFDSNDYLYVTVGSGSNVDADSSRSRVMRYKINSATIIPKDGIVWTTGELFMDGTRNENGLRIDRFGSMWGVENGCDDLMRDDLGGDIHNTNPGEEINLCPPLSSSGPSSGNFYGYPYCWSEGVLASNLAEGATAQWAHPNFIGDGTHNDSWCKNTKNVVKPAYVLPAHGAPLDFQFYETEGTDIQGSFPGSYVDSAFVTLHGSWDRQPALGYRVDFVEFDQTSRKPISNVPFFAFNSTLATGTGWTARPVGLGIGNCGAVGDCLLVTSDSSDGDVFAIAYVNSSSTGSGTTSSTTTGTGSGTRSGTTSSTTTGTGSGQGSQSASSSNNGPTGDGADVAAGLSSWVDVL